MSELNLSLYHLAEGGDLLELFEMRAEAQRCIADAKQEDVESRDAAIDDLKVLDDQIAAYMAALPTKVDSVRHVWKRIEVLIAEAAAEAKFQQAVASYQNTVLKANEEAENGLVQFLRSQQRAESMTVSVGAAEKAVKVAVAQQMNLSQVTSLAQPNRTLSTLQAVNTCVAIAGLAVRKAVRLGMTLTIHEVVRTWITRDTSSTPAADRLPRACRR